MVQETHDILGGKAQLYRREDSKFWWCATRLAGKQRRTSTKKESLKLAEDVATDWYLTLQGKVRDGSLELEEEKTFNQAADKFLAEYKAITKGQRSEKWTAGHEARLRLHLRPFFGKTPLSKITAGTVQDYRVHRMETGNSTKTSQLRKARAWPDMPLSHAEVKRKRKRKTANEVEEKAPKPPAQSTLHDEIVTLNLVLKTAARHVWLAHLPDVSAPYNIETKISHRPWFSPDEYKRLYEASRENALKPEHPHYKWHAEQLHDKILFIGNTGLRPDEIEARNLLHKDVSIVVDVATGQRILEIEVRGKRGVGYCKSMPGAVRPYERLLNRPKPNRGRKAFDPDLSPEMPGPDDPVFPQRHTKMFNQLLKKTKLRVDRDGNPRTAYSLRHTYICLRLMEGADIYQVAKNCRTSVEMIEKHYAKHIKNMLDASAINVMRPKAVRAAEKQAALAPKPTGKAGKVPNRVRRLSGTGQMEHSRDVERIPIDLPSVPGDLTAEI